MSTQTIERPTKQSAKRSLKRIEVDLMENELRQLEELEEELNMSRKQLIRYSLALFAWATKEVRAGKSFGTFDAEAKVAKEVLIPGLSNNLGRSTAF